MTASLRGRRGGVGCVGLIALCLVCSAIGWALQATGVVEPLPTSTPTSQPTAAPSPTPTLAPAPTRTSASPLAAECILLGDDVVAEIAQQNRGNLFAREVYVAASPREARYLAGAYQMGDGVFRDRTTVTVYRFDDASAEWDHYTVGRFTTDEEMDLHAKAKLCAEWARDEYAP